ncbi:hypothetical protein BDN72DRAFT_906071 [Pluteus cervinus]|uniref:Uncharacterized protein n=1 Tax=Pluteus cervinus TaxID=181527 RepID=A0ACD3A1M3_9AGAR|nr:hypothetical protein BDN72DRAFT_906071 [Pluteus cervinus]
MSVHKGKATLLISWVSRQWRELAHDTSALWSQINFKNPDWIQVALSRAKNRELEISLNGLKRIKNNLVPLIPYTLAHLSRIRKLEIISNMGRRTRAIPEDTPEWLFPAPRLVDLNLQALILPPNLFSGIIPCLQSLRLSSCRLDWDTLPVTRGMKKLVLCDPPLTATLDNLIKIFHIIGPDLEELELENVLYPDSQAQLNTGQSRFRFEKLKYLKLEDSELDSIAWFFDHVALPNRPDIQIVAPEWAGSNLIPSLISARSIEKWPIEVLKIKVEARSVALHIVEDWSNSDELAGMFIPSVFIKYPKLKSPASKESNSAQTHIKFEISLIEAPLRFLAAIELLPIQPIKRVVFLGGFHEFQNQIILDWVGKLGTVQELAIDLPFIATFVASISDQEVKLQRFIEEEGTGEADAALDAEKMALGQGLISFHGLRELAIYGELEGETLTQEVVICLQSWLDWRQRFNLQLDRLIIAEMFTPSVTWLTALFDGLVGEFQTRDLMMP